MQVEVLGRAVTVPSPTEQATPRDAPATLSVVIPYYRGAGVICDAVRSVLGQTVRPSEIVICDDGSPDDLEAALGPLLEAVKIVRQENGGIAAAMNTAAHAASGEFLVQLDQDDAFLPQRLELIAATIAARPDVDIIATDALVELQDRLVTTIGAVNPFPASDSRMAIMQNCTFLWPAIRRSLLLSVGGYDERLPVMQDWDCFLRLVLAGGVTAFIHEPLYRWRLTPGSRSSSDRVANIQAQVDMTAKTLRECVLDDDERAAAESLLAVRRRTLAREQARHAISAHASDARALSLQLVVGKGFDRATRVKAAVAVLSPTLADRFIARRRRLANPAIQALAQRGFPPPPSD